VNLVGDCQGGWLAVIYTALHPDTVATLTIAGAPVDFHAGEPLIHDWIQLLSPLSQMGFYRALVAANGGVLPGDALLTGFKIMQPEAETDRQLQLRAYRRQRVHRAVPQVRELVPAHAAHPGRVLPLDRRASLHT
jgi:poly(3-hydroxyalkanoate) synthetase